LTISKTSLFAALASIRAKPLPTEHDLDLGNWVEYEANPDGEQSGSINFCSFCETHGTTINGLGPILTTVINDTILEMDSPARAMQAYKTGVMRAVYYENLIGLRSTTSVRITLFKPALLPRSFKGYCVVIGILFVHLLLFFVIATIFSRTRCSILGNSWLVIAQLANSSHMRDILQYAVIATDKDVKQRIRSNNIQMCGGSSPHGFTYECVINEDHLTLVRKDQRELSDDQEKTS
jgi:hypothetical protein